MLDGIDAMDTVLVTYWNADNTNSRTPSVVRTYEDKHVDIRTSDKILLYDTSENQSNIADLFYNYEDERCYVSVKVITCYSAMTPYTDDHAKKMVDELERLRKLYRKTVGSFGKWERVRGPKETHAYSNKYSGGIWSFTIDYVLKAWGISQ